MGAINLFNFGLSPVDLLPLFAMAVAAEGLIVLIGCCFYFIAITFKNGKRAQSRADT